MLCYAMIPYYELPDSDIGDVGHGTWILGSTESMLDFTLKRHKFYKKNAAMYSDYHGPRMIIEAPSVWDKILLLDRKGVIGRVLTEIKSENLGYCRKMLEESRLMELRHLDGARGTFIIFDEKELFIHFAKEEGEGGETLINTIFSTEKKIVDSHLLMFESLWKRALPSEERFDELDKGTAAPDLVETLKDVKEIQSRFKQLIESAEEEIQMVIPTSNEVRHRESLTFFLEEIVRKRGVKVRYALTVL